jgi:hypothetical protein
MFGSLNRAPAFQEMLLPEQRARAAAFASYVDGDLPGALRYWRSQPDEPKTLSQIALVAESLAAAGESSAALPYIEKLASALPWDAEGIRAEVYWRNRRPREATETLEKFFNALHEQPWPARGLIKRSLTRAEVIANSDRSKIAAGMFYRALREPLCVFNNETERLATALALGIYLDGDHLTEYTPPIVEAFEPHVLWEYPFLQVRKACYKDANNPRAERATRDFDEFMKHQASTSDVKALAKEIETRATGLGSDSNQAARTNSPR